MWEEAWLFPSEWAPVFESGQEQTVPTHRRQIKSLPKSKVLFFSSWLWSFRRSGRCNGAARQRGQAWTWIHIERLFEDAGSPDLFAFDIGSDQLEINPRTQIMIVSIDLASNKFISKLTLTPVEHDFAGRPGSVILFIDIPDPDENDHAENLIGIFHNRPDIDMIRFAAAPIDLDRRVLNCKETRTRNFPGRGHDRRDGVAIDKYLSERKRRESGLVWVLGGNADNGCRRGRFQGFCTRRRIDRRKGNDRCHGRHRRAGRWEQVSHGARAEHNRT